MCVFFFVFFFFTDTDLADHWRQTAVTLGQWDAAVRLGYPATMKVPSLAIFLTDPPEARTGTVGSIPCG